VGMGIGRVVLIRLGLFYRVCGGEHKLLVRKPDTQYDCASCIPELHQEAHLCGDFGSKCSKAVGVGSSNPHEY